MTMISEHLDDASRRIRNILLIRSICVTLLITIPLLLTFIFIDWLWRIPTPSRWFMLVVLLGTFTFLCVTRIGPAIRFKPTRIAIAHRIESRHPGFSGRFATAIDFIESGVDIEDPTINSLIKDIESTDRSVVQGLFKPWILFLWITCLTFILLITTTIAISSPPNTKMGVVRLFWPATDLMWDPRTSVVSLMPDGGNEVHGRGTPLYLRAENTTVGRESDPVLAVYRTRTRGGTWRADSMLLTHQGDGVHERIIDTDTSEIEFSFQTSDAETPTQHIEIIDLPEMTRGTVSITPPEWITGRRGFTHTIELDPSNHNYTTNQPTLLGSRIKLDVKTNRPIPPPSSSDQSTWLLKTFGIDGTTHPDISVSNEEDITIQWTLDETTRLIITPHDVHGLESNDPWIITIDGVEDAPPTVQLTQPIIDQSILPTAVVPLSATAGDDITLTTVGFELRNSDSQSDPDAPTSPEWMHEESTMDTMVDLSTELDISQLDPETGSIYMVRAHARDEFPGDGGGTRRVVSSHRNLQIVDQSKFLSMLRQRLGLLEQRVRTLDDRQTTLQQAARTGVLTNEDRREQASIGRVLDEQQSVLESITEELQMNRTSDRQIESLARFTSQALSRASSASNSATMNIGDGDIEGTLESQEQVRFELREIVAMLGDDERSWVISRRLEELLDTQTGLQQRTAEEAGISAGQDRSTMAPEQVSRLDAISGEQLNLTEEARDFIEALEQRVDTLRGTDDPQSEAMQSALDQAERLRLLDHIRDSAEEVSDARMESALSSQQDAIDALNQIQSQLSDDEEGGIRELVRKLEKLEESIQRLVVFQEEEITALEGAMERGVYTRRDTAMLRLRTNTLSTAADARRSGEGTRFASRPLEQAAGAQGSAVELLRTDPVDGSEVLDQEVKSLDLLSGILGEIQEMAESARQEVAQGDRQELASRYGELVEREAELRGETGTLMDKPRDRRARFEARRLAGVQEKIRIDLITLLESTPELEDSLVFQHAHERIDSVAGGVVQQLQEGHPSTTTLDSESEIVNRLRALVEALKPNQDQDEFSNAAQPQSGSESNTESGGTPQMIPPVTELRLLKSLQISLLEATRRLDENGDGSDATFDQLARQQQELVDLSQDMLDRLQPPAPPDPEPGTTAPGTPITMTPHIRFSDPTPPDPNTDLDGDWPDLDSLLELESDGDTALDTPEPTDTTEEVASPLHQAITDMRTAAGRLSTEHSGLETQRAQRSAIEQLDALIDMAQQQQMNQQPSSSSQGSTPSPGAEPESSTSNQSQSTSGQTPSGDQISMPPPGLDPLLGGVLDDSSTEWGALPSRVRDMLRQGRQETYSQIYERLTAEYYRRLAEDLKRD
jgi:hypothetical protein